MEDFFSYNVTWFIIGFLVALVIIIAIVLIKKSDKLHLTDSNVDNALIFISIIVFVIGIACDFGLNLNRTLTPAFLTTLSTLVFTYIITKRYSNKEYKEKLKEGASTAYRHNKNLLRKLEYEILLIENIFFDDKCHKDQSACEHLNNMFRIRDSLMMFKRDSEENISDSSNLIIEEINTVNSIVKIQGEVNKLSAKISNEDISLEEQDQLEFDKQTYEYEVHNLKMKIEDKPIFRMIMNKELEQTYEMIDLVKAEKAARESRSKKEEKKELSNKYLANYK